jgi:hypothetical protein
LISFVNPEVCNTKDNIKPGTTIINDYWKAYDCLNKEGFEHLKVNHSLNFVDPDSGAHTNTIESTWRALKKSLPKYGIVKPLHDTSFLVKTLIR